MSAADQHDDMPPGMARIPAGAPNDDAKLKTLASFWTKSDDDTVVNAAVVTVMSAVEEEDFREMWC